MRWVTSCLFGVLGVLTSFSLAATQPLKLTAS
jgi:hypothetical protein